VSAGGAAPVAQRAAKAAAVPAAPAASAAPGAFIAPRTPSTAAAPRAPAVGRATIDAAGWPALLEAAGLSGMLRQFALNCVPASFENDVLVLRLDQAVDGRRSRPIEEKLVQGLAKYLGRDLRIVFEVSESALATPARQRVMADHDKAVRAATAFEEDPVVKGLQERFGAEVDAASVKPG